MLTSRRKNSFSSCLRTLGPPLRAIDTNIQDNEQDDQEEDTAELTPRRHSDDAAALPPSREGLGPNSTYPRFQQHGLAQSRKYSCNQVTPLQRYEAPHNPLKPPSYPKPMTAIHPQDSEKRRGVQIKISAQKDGYSKDKANSTNPPTGVLSVNRNGTQPEHHITRLVETGGVAGDYQVMDGYHSVENQRPTDHSVANRQPMATQDPQQPPVTKLNLSPEMAVDVVTIDNHRYKKLKLLGCGGSSKVFKVLAEDYQIYALKEVYLKHVDPAIKAAYTNEIKLLNKLQGKPEIITLHDYYWDKHEGILYLLLDYAEMDLNAAIANNRSISHLPMSTAHYFWIEMLRVVKVIHDEGVVHSDLKPENFVCFGPNLRLIDFGISNRIEEEKTSFERDVRCGTINYMAPETIDTYGENGYFKVGRPSDIWSLGCILYLMVYGRTPFAHFKNKLKKYQAVTNASVDIPFPELPNKAAIDILKKCLQRNPKERPSIDELMDHPFTQYLTTSP